MRRLKFEALTVFTHVTASTLAESPGPPHARGLQRSPSPLLSLRPAAAYQTIAREHAFLEEAHQKLRQLRKNRCFPSTFDSCSAFRRTVAS
jgi:hypothetical protein